MKQPVPLIKPCLIFIGLTLLLLLGVAGCTAVQRGVAILPVEAYERMIVGRTDADYVGTDNCVAKCHSHDRITDYFRLSVHGEQIKPESGLPLVNCETCHGPGSLAIAGIEESRKALGEKGNRCDTTKLLDLKRLPPPAKSLICLKCHSAASTPVLTHWNASQHALHGVSCFDCHNLHEGPHQKPSRSQQSSLCYSCHPDIQAQMRLFAHHPVREGKMGCIDCHEPHGTAAPKMLIGITQKDLCTRCHMDKSGPFIFEHGDVTEECTNCHTPHGSVNRRLLTASQPFLCLQCHSPVHNEILAPGVTKQPFANRCTDCHAMIHGSNSPGISGSGTLVR